MDDVTARRPPAWLLPQSAEYALRAVTCLAHADPQRFVPREEIVDQAHLPTAFAAKVLRRLAAAGLVEAHKGWHGGFRLARRAADVRVMDVLEAMACVPEPAHCAFGYPKCDPAHPCALHPLWSDLQERYLDWARVTTLADTLDVAPEGRERPPGGPAGRRQPG